MKAFITALAIALAACVLTGGAQINFHGHLMAENEVP